MRLLFVFGNAPVGINRRPGGEGQYQYPAVRTDFWQVENAVHEVIDGLDVLVTIREEGDATIATPCLLRMLRAASRIALKTMYVTGRDIRRKSWRRCAANAALRRSM